MLKKRRGQDFHEIKALFFVSFGFLLNLHILAESWVRANRTARLCDRGIVCFAFCFNIYFLFALNVKKTL
ncbi:hypothetical protein DRJ22_02375 [Candidatus Woesearchaeota archaeon]|nr:MAG: hypothetical protein DRJ22_02375 [Candidatus Woesearchaeota archaeon]